MIPRRSLIPSFPHSLIPKLPTLALALVVLVTVAFFGFTHEGLYDLDDFLYARYAHAVAVGTYRPLPDPQHLLHDPLQERLMVFGPVAGFYKLLGVNSISATLWPLLCTLGCAGVVWALYRRHAPVAAAGALLLLGLHYFTLNLSTYLYPDNVLMCWALASAAALLVGRRAGQRRPAAWGAGFAALNLAALLSKETIAFYLPFYLGVLALDAWRRRHGRFWVVALGTGAALLAGLALYYHLLTGDVLYRYHIIEQTNAFMSDGNYVQASPAALRARLTWEPLALLLQLGVGAMLVLAAAAARPRPALPVDGAAAAPTDGERWFWLGLALSTLAFFWWGSTSLNQYNPISLKPRMLTPLLPPLALAGGFGLQQLWRTGRGALAVALALLVAALWMRSAVSVLYGGLGLVLLMTFVGQRRATRPPWLAPGSAALAAGLLAALAGLLLLRPLHFMRKPTVSSHFAQARVLARAAGPGVVFTDEFLRRFHSFYYGFAVPPGLRFARFTARDSVRLAPTDRVWLLVNRSTLTNEELTRQLLRYSADSMLSWFPQRRLVAQDGKVELYEVTR